MHLRGSLRLTTTPGMIKPGVCLLLLCLLFLAGCASYSQKHSTIEQSLLNHNPAQALEQLEKNGHNGRDQFLYHAEKAMILRMLGRYTESNAEIEQAKKIIEQFSATSVSEEGAAFIINDTTRTYTGTPVEQVMLNLYAALNYLALDQLDSARVEVLQVDARLRTLMQDDPDSPLSFDPLARYLSGIIYEDLGEWSDAMIAYRKAYKAYLAHDKLYNLSIPQQLKESLILMAARVGLNDERKKYEKEFGISLKALHEQRKLHTELVFMLHNGLAPIKKEHSSPIFAPALDRLVRISLPAYYERQNSVVRARIRLTGADQYTAKTEITENINSLQIKTLEAHMPAITARALARMVAKYKMAGEAGDKNPAAGILVNLFGLVTERADTRSWLTLPAEIHSARIPVSPGKYSVAVELLDYSDNIIGQRTFPEIEIGKKQKHYLSLHWIANGHVSPP